MIDVVVRVAEPQDAASVWDDLPHRLGVRVTRGSQSAKTAIPVRPAVFQVRNKGAPRVT